MANVTTLPEMYHPIMGKPPVILNRCAVCGRLYPLEQHHIVYRSQGELYVDGVKVFKPTITLCGWGNNLKDSNGKYFCHGLAHAKRLHFRWVQTGTEEWMGHFEYLKLSEPTKYEKALIMDGWRPING